MRCNNFEFFLSCDIIISDYELVHMVKVCYFIRYCLAGICVQAHKIIIIKSLYVSARYKNSLKCSDNSWDFGARLLSSVFDYTMDVKPQYVIHFPRLLSVFHPFRENPVLSKIPHRI